MLQIDIEGILKLQRRLEAKTLLYKEAIDDAIDYSREIILARVESGHNTDGTFRNTNTDKARVGRYSEWQGEYRKARGLSVNKHNLKVDGDLFDNFKRTIGRSDLNKTYKRSLYFSRRTVNNRKITYKELADIQEKARKVAFKLSRNQARLVSERFKNKINGGAKR